MSRAAFNFSERLERPVAMGRGPWPAIVAPLATFVRFSPSFPRRIRPALVSVDNRLYCLRELYEPPIHWIHQPTIKPGK